MKILTAKFISAVLSPLVISILLCYALVYASRLDVIFAIQWSFISILFVLIVGLFVVYGVKKKLFSNYDVSDRRQRPKLFAFAGVVSIFYLAVILLFNGPRVLIIGLLGLISGIVIAIIVNQRIKASIHMEAFTAFAVVMGILYDGPWWLLLLFIPVLAWSRMTLKRHSFPEVIMGTTLGVLLVIFISAIVKYFII